MEEKQTKLLDRIAFWLLCAIMFDCTALGGGTIIEIMGIDIRMILFVLFFVASLPAVLRNFRGLLANGYFVLLFLWGFWTVICTIRGILVGNSIGRIISAWVGFASFVLLPGAICILKSREQILKLMKTIAVAAVLVAAQTAVVLLVYNFMDLDTFIAVNAFMIQEELGGCTGVNDAVVRIFFRSHPLVVVGCICSLYFAIVSEKKLTQFLYCGNIALCLFSLLLSYTRSIYLAALACAGSAVIMLVATIDKTARKNMVRAIAKAVGMVIVLLLSCDIALGGAFLSYGIYRSVGVDVMNAMEVRLGMPNGSLGGGFDLSTESTAETEPDDTDENKPGKKPEKKPSKNEVTEYDPSMNVNAWSDNIRELTVQELYQRIGENPVFGSGMGSTLAVRAALDGNNEYFYLDMTFKTGLIGTFLYVAPMLLLLIMLVIHYKHMDSKDVMICITWLAGLFGVAAFSTLNPYLNGSNGISLYCCTIGAFTALNNKQQLPLFKRQGD